MTQFTLPFLLFLSDISHYIYLSLKVYRILCFTKLTFDQLPLFNPYKWPLSFVRKLVQPYFDFCKYFIPRFRFGKVSYELSAIVGIQFVGSLILSFAKFRHMLLIKIDTLLNLLP